MLVSLDMSITSTGEIRILITHYCDFSAVHPPWVISPIDETIEILTAGGEKAWLLGHIEQRNDGEQVEIN